MNRNSKIFLALILIGVLIGQIGLSSGGWAMEKEQKGEELRRVLARPESSANREYPPSSDYVIHPTRTFSLKKLIGLGGTAACAALIIPAIYGNICYSASPLYTHVFPEFLPDGTSIEPFMYHGPATHIVTTWCRSDRQPWGDLPPQISTTNWAKELGVQEEDEDLVIASRVLQNVPKTQDTCPASSQILSTNTVQCLKKWEELRRVIPLGPYDVFACQKKKVKKVASEKTKELLAAWGQGKGTLSQRQYTRLCRKVRAAVLINHFFQEDSMPKAYHPLRPGACQSQEVIRMQDKTRGRRSFQHSYPFLRTPEAETTFASRKSSLFMDAPWAPRDPFAFFSVMEK